VAVYAANIVTRPTSVEVQPTETPATSALKQSYPNPFNVSTTIWFSLPARQIVSLTVHNLAGQQVVTLVRGAQQAGTYTVTWDGGDDRGRALASGLHLYRLQAGGRQATRKLLLLR
jgi:flagellar hook assembly protein FlgD